MHGLSYITYLRDTITNPRTTKDRQVVADLIRFAFVVVTAAQDELSDRFRLLLLVVGLT